MRVMKFGGSSVGSPERMSQVLELIVKEREASPLAVVVSAMGDTTDHLIEAADLAARGDAEQAERVVDRIADLATANGLLVLQLLERALVQRREQRRPPQITPMVRELLGPLRKLLHGVSLLRERTAQTLDLVMSFGERLSASVVAELLSASGIEAGFVDAREWLITDARFGAAMVDWEATKLRLGAKRPAWERAVTIHTGFIGQTPDGRTTTLGRNGSDYTATLLARGLGASEVVIWTDVSGVMTADPALISDAYPIARMSYMEALELAGFGARMFHPRTMIPLMESGIPMRIRNTMHPAQPGTLIDGGAPADEEARPTCVTSLENLALLDLRWRKLSAESQLGERALRALDLAKVTVWMASQAAHGQAVAVVIPVGQVGAAERAITEALALEFERGEVEAIGVRKPITLLSLVEERMGRAKNVPGRFFQSLGAVGVQICAIAQGASSRSISCAIEAADTALAVRAVHAAFNFAHQDVSLFVLGRGTVGGHLLDQIQQQASKLLSTHGVALKVVGIGTRRGVAYDHRGIELSRWREVAAGAPAMPFDLAALEKLRRLPVPILVDCTAADGMEGSYLEAFARGIHVVSANKKPLTIPWSARERLMAAARRHYRAYHYETTVGASLPVIETLKNLVRTGDRVQLIEGSLSGTLGYLANEAMRGVPLSKAVETARECGYTEPHPQDDLSGLDVARKALILARELGIDLELADIAVEPLVPRAIIEEESLDGFFAALRAHDAAFNADLERMRGAGRALRYLVRIDPGARGAASGAGAGKRGLAKVGPVAIEAAHPAQRLRGSEAFVAFSTERYSDYPLIVQGAGAGGAVTAAGVLADVLRIAQDLRGR
jgi:aspartokinase/homoserine dehydrogenase 1